MDFNRLPIFPISTLAGLAAAALANSIQPPEVLPPATVERHLPAAPRARADVAHETWESLYSRAAVVAQVEVIADGVGVVSVSPLVTYKSDGAPVRYLMRELVFCGPPVVVGDTYLVFAERAPVPADNTLKVINSVDLGTRSREDGPAIAELLAQLEAWSGVHAGAPERRLARAETGCAPLG